MRCGRDTSHKGAYWQLYPGSDLSLFVLINWTACVSPAMSALADANSTGSVSSL
jgi:hypothetical protein